MLIPIACAFKNDDVWNSLDAWNKIEFWYWSSLFSGSYREAQNEKAKNDTKEINSWISKVVDNPYINRKNNIFKATSYSDLDTLLMKGDDNTVPKAIHLGLLQFILSRKPLDFIPFNGENINLSASSFALGKKICIRESNGDEVSEILKLEDHHIFPLAQETEIGKSSKEIRKNKTHILNSPLNRTFISNIANGDIGGRSPIKYFQDIKTEVLNTHFIYPEDYVHMYENGNHKYEDLLKKRFSFIQNTLSTHLVNLV